MLDTFVKRYAHRASSQNPQRGYGFATAIRHQGRVISLALALDESARPQIYYSVLDAAAAAASGPTGAGPSSARDIDGWTATPVLLSFPNEIAQVGFGLADQTVLPVFKKGAAQPEAPGAAVPVAERDEFRSTTARLTAAQPFQALSDGQYVYVFRQAVAAGNANNIAKRYAPHVVGDAAATSLGDIVRDAAGNPVPVVDSTLLVDRFLLTGDRLVNVREVRFQRSRSKTRPASRRDGLGDRDLDGQAFIEPTLELAFVNQLHAGRFTALLVPTLVAGLQRWHVMAHNAATGRIDLYSVERSADGLFNPRGTQFYTSPDPEHRGDVFEARPGKDPFTGEDLVPFVEPSDYAESALEFDGATAVALDGGVDLTGPFTLEMWIRPARPSDVQPQRLIGAGKTLAGARRTNDTPPSVWIEDMNRLRIGFGSAGVWAEHLTPRVLKVDVWTHVAISFDGTALRTYVDGRLRDQTEDLAGHAAGAALTAIGGATEGFEGRLDEVRVWSRARGGRELAAQRGQRLVGNELGLAAYWRCDEASGTRVYDQTDHRHDASVTRNGAAAPPAVWVTSDAPVTIGAGLTRTSFSIGSDDGSGGTAVHSVETGLSAVLYHEQTDVRSGYDGTSKKLKQSARVMLAFGTRAPGSTRTEIATVDLGVAATGQLAQVPDVVRLARIESGAGGNKTINEQLDELAALERQRRDLINERDELNEDVASLQPVVAILDQVFADNLANVVEIGHPDYRYLNESIRAFQEALRAAGPAIADYQAAKNHVEGLRADFYLHVNYVQHMLSLGPGRHTDLGASSKQLSSFRLAKGLILDIEGDPPVAYRFAADQPNLVNVKLNDGSNLNDRIVTIQLEVHPALLERLAALEAAARSQEALAEEPYRELEAARRELRDRLSHLADRIRTVGAELTTIESRLGAVADTLHQGALVNSKHLATDARGLTISGGILGFAWTIDTPTLFDSAMGSVALYFRGEADQYFSAYYNTFTERARYILNDEATNPALVCAARSTDPEMDGIVVEVRDGDDAAHCTVVVSTPDIVETWTHVPRLPRDVAAILNGEASLREFVGRATAEHIGGKIVALVMPAGIRSGCQPGATLVVGDVPVVVTEVCDSGATRIAVSDAAGPIPDESLPVYHLPYDYDRHASTTKIPADLYNGSLLVTAQAGDLAGAVVNQRAISGTTLSSRWTAEAPGSTLAFDGSATRAAAGGPLSGLDVGDDLTIEGWLRPADVDEPMRVLRHKSGLSEYGLGLEPVRRALRFDGRQDLVDHKSRGLDPKGSWTVSLWFRADRTDGENFLFNKGNYAAAVRNGFVQVKWGGGRWLGEQTFPVSVGRWYHVAFVRDGGRCRIFRNGVELAVPNAVLGLIGPNDQSFIVGAASPGRGHFAGAISALRIWETVRTDRAIQQDRDGDLDAADASLVGAWAYGDVDRNRILSLTSSRRHGATVGNPQPIATYDVLAGVNGRYGRSRVGFESGHWVHLAAAFKQSYAVELEGGGAHLSCPHSPGLDLAGDLTIEAVIRPRRLGATQGLVAKGELGGSDPVPYALGIDPDGYVLFSVVDAAGDVHSVRSAGKVTTGTHHVGVSRRRRSESVSVGTGADQALYTLAWDEINFFIDGAAAGTQLLTEHANVVRAFLALDGLGDPGVNWAVAAAEKALRDAARGSTNFPALELRGNDEPVELGRWRSTGVVEVGGSGRSQDFGGILSEIRVSSRALDADEIGASGASGEGLAAAWQFEERTGTIAHDPVGSNDAEFSGSVSWVKDPDAGRASLVLYRNGVALPVFSASSRLAGSGVRQSTVGALHRSGGYVEHYRGEVDELRIWQVPRSEEQIQDNLFRRLVASGSAASNLAGEELDLVAYYSFDARLDDQIADKGPRGNHLSLANGANVLSTAPVGVDAPHIRSALAGVKTDFHGTVHSPPGIAEYADVAYDDDGNLVGTFKRCYASVEAGEWQLVTGFKVGDLTTDWIGQVQFAPQLIGYIEGAPPVPSENLTATGYVRGEFAEYVNASSVELTQASSVNRRYSAEKETGADLNVDFKLGGIIGAHAEAGLFLVVESVDVENVIGFHGNFETSWGWLAETSTTVGRSTTQELSMALRGSVENENAVAYPAVGRRFVPDNMGMAFVTSETADLFALRLAHNGALVSFQIRPNPDIPPDQNIITFPINPRYTKQGSLDGKVGFEPDPNYPNALTYSSDLSYFKPIEAYALRNAIDADTAARRTRYLQYDAGSIGRQAPRAGGSLEERLTSPAAAEHKRSLVNRYVWTADGGLFAESEETLAARSETLGGSYEFQGMGGLFTDLTFAVFSMGFKFELDLMIGGHLNRTVTKSEETEETFGLSVDLGGVESDTYLRNARGELVMDLSDSRNPKPKRQPGRVDAYRFMSYYLEPTADAFDTFFNKVVDPIWLEQSSDPAAAALREAKQDAKRPPAWRIMHRVTYVSRVLPEFSADAPPSLEKTMRRLEIDSNYELIRLLEPFVVDHLGSEEEFAVAVDQAVGTYVPELKPHLPEIKSYLRLYFGVGAVADVGDAALDTARALDRPPVVIAGPDQVVGLSGSSEAADLAGNIIDDRYDTTEAIYVTWELAAGPTGVRFGDAHSAATTVDFNERGRYTMRITADDGRLRESDTLDIVVNEPPVADAGPRQGLRPASGRSLRDAVPDDDPSAAWIDTQLAADADRAVCRLAGRVVDDGLGDPDAGLVTTRWDQVSGAGIVEFSPDGRFASFSSSGHYMLRFTVDNETFTVDTQVVIEVAARVSDGLQALYTFQEAEGDQVRDVAGLAEPCDLRIADPATVERSADALSLRQPSLITSNGHASRINRSLVGSGEVTVEVWMEAAETAPEGLRRIVTLSTGPAARNLTLGQSEDALHLALRTSRTNVNASDVAFSVPGAVTAGLHHFAATRSADGSTRVYVDGGLVAERSVPGDLSTWDELAELVLGNEPSRDGGVDTAFLGTLHLVALYDRALTAEEVDQNWRYGANTDLPPVVNAGSDRVIDAPSLPAMTQLAPHIVHDRPTEDEEVSWVMVSGPADADFDDARAHAPAVTLPSIGRYRMRLSVEAGGAMTSDEVALVVNTTPALALPSHVTVLLPEALDLSVDVLDDGLGEPSQGELVMRWTAVDPPSRVTFGDPDAASTTVRFAGHGLHTLRVEVDNGHFVASAEVAARVYAVPALDATATPVVTLDGGVARVSLEGAIEDAGLGDPSAEVTAAWTQVSGPVPATIEGADQLVATVVAERNGDYVFELTVDNGKLSAATHVGVTINQAPIVDAGGDLQVVLPRAVSLDATVGDDGLPHDPGEVAMRWSQASGPGLVLFEDSTADRTQARFTLPGTYRLEIVADDGAAATSDTLDVEVLRPPRIVDGLLAHYEFDGGEGATIADIAGVSPALDLEIIEGSPVAWVAGGLQLTGAAPLVAANSAQRVLDAIAADGGTIEAVVTPSGGMTFRRSVARIVALGDEWGPIVSISQDGEGLRGALHFDRGRRRTSQSVGVELSDPLRRVQVVYSFDPAAKEVRMYLDGVEVAAGNFGGTWPPGSATVPSLMLADASGGTDWLGTFHAVAVYGRTLDTEEVLTNYYAGID
ncbi:MAG TPA: LamG-like jellyroll fold domain-containing protein [Acidimicrobiia bacterium]|nr:LamG-like jellyroll fold domain-containing protein [Acidimicrobiia bacterium]